MNALARSHRVACKRVPSVRKLIALSIGLALCSGTAVAMAQGTTAQDGTPSQAKSAAPASTKGKKAPVTLKAITVTARQRAELSRDVPIAITTFDAQQIQDAGIQTPADFIQMTPNVSMVQAQNAGTDFLTIRGITQVRNSEPSVATVVDGVQQVSPNQFNQFLYDLQSIQVLKGPQGALYGRNAIGGAILITTKPPPSAPSAWVQLGAGNGDLRKGIFSVGGPIGSGKVRYLVSGVDSFFGGLIQNTYLKKPVDNARNRGVRARVVANVTDNFKLDTVASVSRTIGGSLIYVYQPLFGVSGDANDTSIPITSNNKGYDERKLDHFSMRGDYTTSVGTLRAIVAVDHINESYGGDQLPYSPAISANAPFGPGTDGTQTQYIDTNAEQVGLRFTSPSDQRLRWIVGAAYLNKERYVSTTTGIDLGQGIIHVKEAPAPGTSTNPTATFLADRTRIQNPSVYGQVAYDITSELEADVAWRYDSFKVAQIDESILQFDPHAGAQRNATFRKSQPKFTLTYKPNSNFTVYGSYGVGFRRGGFNQNGTGAAASSAGLIGVSDLYQPETNKSTELGFKSLMDGGRLQVDGSVFSSKDSNQMYYVFVGAVGAQIVASINRVNLRGYELDAKFRVASDLLLYGNYGSTHSSIRAFSLDPSTVGNRAPYVPRYTASVGFEYSPTLTRNINGMLRVDYEFMGPQYWDPENTTERDAVHLLNLHVGIQQWDDKWSATLWARNLTNKRYNAEYVLGGFTQIAEPRSYGIDVRYKFL